MHHKVETRWCRIVLRLLCEYGFGEDMRRVGGSGILDILSCYEQRNT